MTIIYEKEQIETVIRELRAGKVIAFPTDTVYGLGVCYDDEDALQRLKAAKGRPENKPIPTMVGNRRQLDSRNRKRSEKGRGFPGAAPPPFHMGGFAGTR